MLGDLEVSFLASKVRKGIGNGGGGGVREVGSVWRGKERGGGGWQALVW